MCLNCSRKSCWVTSGAAGISPQGDVGRSRVLLHLAQWEHRRPRRTAAAPCTHPAKLAKSCTVAPFLISSFGQTRLCAAGKQQRFSPAAPPPRLLSVFSLFNLSQMIPDAAYNHSFILRF